jgi:vancomycin resistance protein YoaR
LSTGRSNFKGSGAGRKSNVRKALNERVNNIFVPAGAVFSFNDTLGTVSTGNGWQMALTIFDGVDLRPAPGGGICQASTTVYRAALAAGFPIMTTFSIRINRNSNYKLIL